MTKITPELVKEHGLSDSEYQHILKLMGREPSFVELGICNGFQVLTEAGLLPGALMRNAGLKFLCKPVALTVEETQSSVLAPASATYAPPATARMALGFASGNCGFSFLCAALQR